MQNRESNRLRSWETNRQLGEQQSDHATGILSEESELRGYTMPRVEVRELEHKMDDL